MRQSTARLTVRVLSSGACRIPMIWRRTMTAGTALVRQGCRMSPHRTDPPFLHGMQQAPPSPGKWSVIRHQRLRFPALSLPGIRRSSMRRREMGRRLHRRLPRPRRACLAGTGRRAALSPPPPLAPAPPVSCDHGAAGSRGPTAGHAIPITVGHAGAETALPWHGLQQAAEGDLDGLTFVAGSPGRAAAAGLAPVIVPDHPEKQRPTDSTAGADLLAAEQAFRRPVPASALAPMAGPSGGLLPDPAALPLLAHTLPHASTGAMAHAPALPNIGASIGQLALAIVDPGRHAKDKVTEIRLSPDELGSVRVTLQTDAADPDRIAVMLSFDRPDTLDLFRRHAEQLTEALRLAGFPRAEIGFGQHGADQWQSGTPGSGREEPRRYGGASDAMPADAAVKPGVLRQSATPASSLDLRL